MSKLNTKTLKEVLDLLSSGAVSHAELYADLNAAEADHKDLNIFLSEDEAAEEKSAVLSSSEKRLPLRGVPISVKDNYATRDIRTSASSTLLSEFVPAYDATVIEKLKEAGIVVKNKTNMDAWAHGSSTETSQFDLTKNPRNTDHLPGGSSGGSAAAVASDTCIAALGTETAGSVRQPSAWCGTVGLKPTYGRTSRYGIVAMASSTDSPGPMTKTVEDAAILFDHMAGPDPKDATTSNQAAPKFTKEIGKSIEDLKIGVLYMDEEGLNDIRTDFEAQLEVLSELGAQVDLVDARNPHESIGVYTVVQRAEVSSNLARFTNVRYQHSRETFGDEARRRVMLGTFTLSKGYADKYYNTAQKVRQLFIDDFKKLFSEYDVLISPTSPGYAKKIGASEGEAMFGELEDLLLEPSSIAGLPALNVPCYRDPKTNLFLGMNIMAAPWREDLIVRVGDAFEKATEWNTWRNR